MMCGSVHSVATVKCTARVTWVSEGVIVGGRTMAGGTGGWKGGAAGRRRITTRCVGGAIRSLKHKEIMLRGNRSLQHTVRGTGLVLEFSLTTLCFQF